MLVLPSTTSLTTPVLHPGQISPLLLGEMQDRMLSLNHLLSRLWPMKYHSIPFIHIHTINLVLKWLRSVSWRPPWQSFRVCSMTWYRYDIQNLKQRHVLWASNSESMIDGYRRHCAMPDEATTSSWLAKAFEQSWCATWRTQTLIQSVH